MKRLLLVAAIAIVVILTFASAALAHPAHSTQYAQYDQYAAGVPGKLLVLPDTGGPSLVLLPLGALLLGCGILVAKRAAS